MTTSERSRRRLIQRLHDKEYRDGFVAEHVGIGLPTQIRALRESREWTQGELGKKAEMAAERISVLENPEYGKYTLSTLLRLASAFDVALIVRFAPFSEIMDWGLNLSPQAMAPRSFDEEEVFLEAPLNEPTESAALRSAFKVLEPPPQDSGTPPLTGPPRTNDQQNLFPPLVGLKGGKSKEGKNEEEKKAESAANHPIAANA